MRCPSDAQARVLQLVIDKAQEGHVLLWSEVPHGGKAALSYEVIDREANTARLVSWYDRTREASVAACVKYGWLDDTHEKTRISRRQHHDGHVERFTELRLTDDGDLALNLWQHRKLHAPPPPLPTLDPHDLETLRVAADAAALGYALVPSYRTHDRREAARMDASRKQMRRLVRDGWALRTYVGTGQSAIVPTATGAAEVASDPDAILTPPGGTHGNA